MALEVCGNLITQAKAKAVKSQLSSFSAIYLSCLNALSFFSKSKLWNHLNWAYYLVVTPVFESFNLPWASLSSKYLPVKYPDKRGL